MVGACSGSLLSITSPLTEFGWRSCKASLCACDPVLLHSCVVSIGRYAAPALLIGPLVGGANGEARLPPRRLSRIFGLGDTAEKGSEAERNYGGCRTPDVKFAASSPQLALVSHTECSGRRSVGSDSKTRETFYKGNPVQRSVSPRRTAASPVTIYFLQTQQRRSLAWARGHV